jgi:hypothetical protein
MDMTLITAAGFCAGWILIEIMGAAYNTRVVLGLNLMAGFVGGVVGYTIALKFFA